MNPYEWGKGDKRRLSSRDFPPEVIALVEKRQGGRFCEDCRALGLVTPPEIPLEVDHKQPLAKDGTNHHLNLRLACRSHNRGRGARPLELRPPRPKWSYRR